MVYEGSRNEQNSTSNAKVEQWLPMRNTLLKILEETAFRNDCDQNTHNNSFTESFCQSLEYNQRSLELFSEARKEHKTDWN